MTNKITSLIIFSTDFIYPENNNLRSEDLFNSNRIFQSIPSESLDNFFEEEFEKKNKHKIFQIKNKDGRREAIFGRKMLEYWYLDKKEVYLKNLVLDILLYIKNESNTFLNLDELQEIKLIAHRKEFYNTKNINKYKLEVEDQDLFIQIAEIINKTLGKRLEYSHSKDIGQVNKEKIFIELIPFSHDPGHLIFRLLKNFKEPSTINIPLSEQIKQLIEDDKIDFEEKFELGDLKLMKNGLGSVSSKFNYHFFEVNESGLIKHVEKIDLLTPRNKTIAQLLDINQNDTAYDLAVLFAPVKLLSDFEFYKRIPNFFHNKGKKPFEPFSVPLLTISYPNYMAYQLKVNSKNHHNIESETSLLTNGVYDDLKNDDHFRFLDSSIWYRYASYASNQIFNNQLSDALHTFYWAYERKLYNKCVTKEYLEFSNRLIENAFLDNQFGQGHASLINPFKFHSEYFMKVEGEKRYHILTTSKNRFNKNIKKNIKWNVLLLDDYGKSSLPDIAPSRFENNNESSELSKHEIISELIDNPLEKISKRKENGQTTYSILNDKKIDVITDIEKTPEIIKQKVKPERIYKKVYDIILLDYLFSKTDDDKPRYGIEFLEKIIDKNLTDGKSLFQFYWIYPISVFSDAMLSSFKEKGIQPINDNWQLARGADPINTPQLFRFSFLDFLKVQFDKLHFDKKELFQFFQDNPIVTEVKGKKVKREDKKKWAIKAFRKFIEQFSGIEGVPDGSAFGKTMKTYMHDYEGEATRLMQSIRQLLYMLAYTTGFDATILHLEYKRIREALDNYIEKQTEQEPETQKSLEKIEKQLNELGLAIHEIYKKYK